MALETLQCCTMLWQCIIARTNEHYEGHTPPPKPNKLNLLAWGVVTHPFGMSVRSARPHVGLRGPFPPAAGMVVVVVTPVVCCAMATEKYNRNTKINCL
jgi:hypothetical protein